MKITVLGSGTSTGVPQIGCRCEVCRSTDKRDKRLRCSSLVDVDGVKILIDCGPDFREQMLSVPFAKLDAVLITHEHYDHVGGQPSSRAHTILFPSAGKTLSGRAVHQSLQHRTACACNCKRSTDNAIARNARQSSYIGIQNR